MEQTTPRPANHLVNETSPYLLQHAHNPVAWYPWGEEALARSKAENKPIFLSIGYAACHWCHVMERESFENDEIARILNEHFISIKVDREERPDLDDLYMQAVQLLTGSGGWPMTVFLTPDLKPFFGGTYFPPDDRYGHPGFRRVLLRIHEVYTREHDKVRDQSDALLEAIEENTHITRQTGGALTWGLVERAVSQLRARFDAVYGGFGGAPKFPPSFALNLLLREFTRTGDTTLRPLIEVTLDKMARGGMYDQFGGGFHRYSTDAQWLVPHFEKMLYDNALLAPVYFDAALALEKPEYERVGREILDWTLREMCDPQGGFHSTLDADSEGVEGKFYTWKPDEVKAILTTAGFSVGDAQRCLEYFDITERGNWHEAFDGGSIANARMPLDEFAAVQNLAPAQTREVLDRMRATLLQARTQRVWPGKDDKVLASWNGLMISALARGAQVTGDARYLDAAQAAADFVLGQMRTADGELLHSWRGGQARVPGLLEDYACVLRALVDFYETGFEPHWLAAADQLAEVMLKRFYDEQHGGFFTTDGRDASVLVRMKDFYDGATPSGNSVAVHALLRLGLLLDDDDQRLAARKTMEGIAMLLDKQPAGYQHMLCAVSDELTPLREVAIIGDPDGADTRELLKAVWCSYAPARVMACALNDERPEFAIALLAGKPQLENRATAYVCRNYTCAAPTHEVSKLRAQLRGL